MRKLLIFCMILLIMVSSVPLTLSAQTINDTSKKNEPFCGIAPFYLRPGDLVLCEIRDVGVLLGGVDVQPKDPFGFDHVALYAGKGFLNPITRTFIPHKLGRDYVIEATFLPFTTVRYTPLSLLHLYCYIRYGAVKDANETQKQNALAFADSQLGKTYQHFSRIPRVDNPYFPWQYRPFPKDDPRYPFYYHANCNPGDPIDPFSDWYYCADLVWAAYMNCNGVGNVGIDLDPVFPEKREDNHVVLENNEIYYLRLVTPGDIWKNTDKVIQYPYADGLLDNTTHPA